MEMVEVSGEVTLGLSIAIDIDVGVVKLNNRDQGKSKKTVQIWVLEFLTPTRISKGREILWESGMAQTTNTKSTRWQHSQARGVTGTNGTNALIPC